MDELEDIKAQEYEAQTDVDFLGQARRWLDHGAMDAGGRYPMANKGLV
jgi:hypothetical protein